MRKKLFFFILISIFPFIKNAYADHLMGGEITWTCATEGVDAGKFIFHMKEYRDCSGIPGETSITLTVHNYADPSLTSIPMILVSQSDISPKCYQNPGPITCANENLGSVEEFIFISNPIELIGTPPPDGWVFTWTSCCRGTLVNMGYVGFTLRAIMHSLNGQEIVRCYDESPSFSESPATVICAGSPLIYSQHAYDTEQDSLVYSWGVSLEYLSGPFTSTNPVPATFTSGYAFDSPFPGIAQDPNNVPATMDSLTGQISLTSYTTGSFVTCIRVEAYKCGFLVAEIFRELNVAIIPCTIQNAAPQVSAPFMDSLTGLYTLFSDTVVAGDFVSFDLKGVDAGTNPAFPPSIPSPTPQLLTMTAFSNQFGDDFIDPNLGCSNPPCATLFPPPPMIGTDSLITHFEWQTDCNHIKFNSGCNNTSNTYDFLINMKDNYCPTPGITTSVIKITVLETPPPIVFYVPNVLFINEPGPYFQWFLDGIPIGGAIYAQYVPLQNGTYVVRVTSISGCYKDSPPYVLDFLDLANLNPGLLQVKIYPNPAKDIASIEINNNMNNEHIQVSLTNMMGKVYSWEVIESNELSIKKELNLHDLSPGVYFINVKSNNGNQNLKVVKL